MHSSSHSIAAIASALAKAQTALVNPEKTMTATIRDDRRGQGAERSFRYAPLSAGSISSARRWASMRSPWCRPPPSTRRRGPCA